MILVVTVLAAALEEPFGASAISHLCLFVFLHFSEILIDGMIDFYLSKRSHGLPLVMHILGEHSMGLEILGDYCPGVVPRLPLSSFALAITYF